MLETAKIRHQRIQHPLADVPERRMSEVVPETKRLGQTFIKPKATCYSSADLGDFDAVRQPRAVVIVQTRSEYLSFALQPPKSLTMNNSVPVPLETFPIRVWFLRASPALTAMGGNGVIA
jgi:hypothetical protein